MKQSGRAAMAENSKPDHDDDLVAHVAGRTLPDERAGLAAAAANDQDLAAEIATLAAIRNEIRSSGEAAHGASDEFGWARLSRAIDQDRQHASAVGRARRWRAVAAIAVIAFAVQMVASLTAPGSGPARFETAAVEAARPHLVQVTFSPDAREGDVRALLISADGQIVEGPSSLGVYLVAFDNEAAREAGLTAFLAAGAIVSFAAAQ